MSISCVSCNQLITNNDWLQKNVFQNTKGLTHKQCKSKANELYHRFVHKHDFDQNGIIYWIGTNKGTKRYNNPVFSNKIDVTCSTFHNDSDHTDVLIGRENAKCFTGNSQNSWFMIDLKDTKIIPTHYTLKYSPAPNVPTVGAPRHWALKASNNSRNDAFQSWDLLMQHISDTKLDEMGGSYTWKIPPNYKNKHKSYSKFEICQFNVNSNGSHVLALSGFELYGTILSNTEQINEPGQSMVEHKVDDIEQTKLINNLISENDRIKREFDEYKQIAESKEKSLVATIFRNIENKSDNNEVKQEYDQYKQLSEATQRSLNGKIIEKENDLKQLQASLFSSYSQNKEYEIQLGETEQLMVVLRNENGQFRAQLRQLQNVMNEEEKKDDLSGDKCKLKFENWLCNIVKLPQYLQSFKKNEYDDIRMIEYLDENTMKNEISIKNIHCKLLLRKVNEFKASQMVFGRVFDMHESLKDFKQVFELNGILTLQEYKNSIPYKKDLEGLLHVNDKTIIDLMWSAICPQVPESQVNNEGNATALI
eukprot:387682_1